MSSVEDSSSENCSGVRIGLRVFVAGSWEGKMEMWRGLFCGGGNYLGSVLMIDASSLRRKAEGGFPSWWDLHSGL